MPITKQDLKLRRSVRMTDAPEGGGPMSAEELVDGEVGELFPPVSEMDRLTGALDVRKIWGACSNDDSTPLLGAQLLLDAVSADAGISVVLYRSPDWQAGAGVTETRQQVLPKMSAAGGSGAGWYGAKPLLAAAAAGARTVRIGSPRARLIPARSTAAAASGVASVGATVDALVPAGAAGSAALSLVPYAGLWALGMEMDAMPGTLSGTATMAGAAEPVTVGSALVGRQERPTWGGELGWYYVEADSVLTPAAGVGYSWASCAVSYTPAAWVTLSRRAVVLPAAQTVSATLPHLPAVGSERISWIDAAGVVRELVFGVNVHATTGYAVADIDRATGGVSAYLNPAPAAGSDVTITYARAGMTDFVAAPPAWSSYQTTLPVTFGRKLAFMRFVAGGVTYRYEPDTGAVRGEGVLGSYDHATNVLTLPLPDGTTPTSWHAIEVEPDTVIGAAEITFVAAAGMTPGTVSISGDLPGGGGFDVTADEAGEFADAAVSGQYSASTGRIDLVFSAPFYGEISWAGESPELELISIPGIAADNFPGGEVEVIRAGEPVSIHDVQRTAPQIVAVGSTLSAGRGDLAAARVIGADGVEIAAGYSVDLDAGTATVSDVTGWVQPVQLEHRIEDVALAQSVTDDGIVTLNRPLSRDYAAGAWCSSLAVLGDLEARVLPCWALQTWGGDWSARTPAPSDSVFSQGLHQIIAGNAGAVAQEWALQLTSTTTFSLLGDTLGVIATGSTGADFAPVNPATGAPYFTLPAAGWGMGWDPGNVVRLPTRAAAAPVWVVRSISPSDEVAEMQSATVALRGSI